MVWWKKIFIIIGLWDFDPALTLTDKVALAWSGDFIAASDTAEWSYSAHGEFWGGTGIETWNGNGYDDYNAGSGLGKAIDIVDSFNTYTYDVYAHSGDYTVDVHQHFYVDTDISVVGQYFHQDLGFGGIGLSFSGASISAGTALNPHPPEVVEFDVP